MSLLAEPPPADPSTVTPAAPVVPPPSAAPAAIPAWMQADGTFSQDWTKHVPDDLKERAIALEKFKNPFDLARSYVHAEKKLGERIAPPGVDATPEQKAAWFKLTGVPESPDKYELKPAQLPEGVEWDEGAAKAAAAVFHEIGLTPAQAQRLAAYDAERNAAAGTASQQQQDAYLTAQKTELAKEYGDKLDSTLRTATEYAKLIGLPLDHPALIHADVVKALARGAGLISESKLVRADAAGSAMTPKERQRSIQTNPSDPWYKAYQGQEGPERQQEAQRILQSLFDAS